MYQFRSAVESLVSSYYSPTRKESVETEEALKAGQVVEPDSDTQFCARVGWVDDANSVNSSAIRMTGLLSRLVLVLEIAGAIVEQIGSV